MKYMLVWLLVCSDIPHHGKRTFDSIDSAREFIRANTIRQRADPGCTFFFHQWYDGRLNKEGYHTAYGWSLSRLEMTQNGLEWVTCLPTDGSPPVECKADHQ